MKRFCISLLRGVMVPCLLIAALASEAAGAETDPRFYAVEVSATVQEAPPQITLQWTADTNATGHTIYRKAPTATSWSPITNLSGSATNWIDQNVADSGSYEYAITKSTTPGYQGTGYILAGINAPIIENRGTMLLIVDNTHAAALATELIRLQQDLVGDGWTVIRHDVARTTTPPQVKQLIQNAYNADPANVKSVLLFGHVAVPYSGNYYPDGHPDHEGAWAADTYYADMNGSWTDFTVNNTAAEKEWNRNSPGDGKFDQSDLPSDVELAVGRVDLYNMTCFANKAWSRSELDLLRAYLNKNHDFRHGKMDVPRRGLVCDNFGEADGEAFASTAWRSFAPFFGAENNVQVPYGQYFPTLRDSAYLWSYGTGGGGWYTCNGIGSSDDFATTEIKTVFTAFLGSYFGDWDNESAFLRAPLGSGWALASAWGGRPHWFFHPMGLGETIGTAAVLSQNNRSGGLYAGQNWGTYQVHVTLLGDPSLRMHPVIPPSSVTATAETGVALAWAASTDTGIQGYNVYRGDSANGPFAKISGPSPLADLSFTDPAGTTNSFYMVRAVKLEQSGSGTYLNLSQGIVVAPQAAPTPAPNSATFVTNDLTTSGSWKGIYGADGAVAAYSDFAFPTNVQVNANYNYPHILAHPSTDPRALQKRVGTSRFATIWNNSGEIFFYLQFRDTATHRVSFYFCDFDRAGREEQLEFYDMSTGQLLAATNITNFQEGLYSTWNLKGRIRVRLTSLTATTTVLSGIFFDPATTPPSGATNDVRFLGANTTTGGAWNGTFGTQGAQLAAEGISLPSYANVTFAGKADHVWNWNTGDTAALQKMSASDRLAACWYSPGSFEVRVNMTDGQTHKVSFYALDWDAINRTASVRVLDGTTRAVLHTTSLAGFSRGTWLSYDVNGSVTFRFTRITGGNAVISGLFFDAPSAPL